MHIDDLLRMTVTKGASDLHLFKCSEKRNWANNYHTMSAKKTKITITAEDLLTIPEAAKEFGVHFATVYWWIDKGRIHPFRIGGQVFVTIDEVRTLKEQRASE